MIASGSSQAAASVIRWRIAGLLLAIITLTFIDRFNMSVAAKYIQQEFQLSNVQVGSLLSAFVLGYALFQVPGGMLGDRFGPRRMLVWAVLWWSAFTALTAVAPDLFLARWIGVAGSLWVVRFLIGCGEAPAFPNANKMIGLWMAPDERARGNSSFIIGVGVGGAFTPPAIAWTMAHYGWRICFVACGALGLLAAAAWLHYSTDRPEQHPGVNRAELVRIGITSDVPRTSVDAPWGRIFSSGTVWALVLSNLMLGYVTYIFYTWFYLYVVNVRRLPVINGSYWSTAPFVVMLFSAPLGGYLSDRMLRTLGHPWGRRVPVFAGSALSCVLLLIGARIADPYWAICTLAVAGGCNIFVSVSCWVMPNDLSRRYSGSLAGLLNMANNLGGAISPTLTPLIAARYGWTSALDFAALTMAGMGSLWFFVHPEKGIDATS
jgi:ACS family glucarate transporter-like MFS transporter